MDTPTEDIPYTKNTPSAAQDGPKKKKTSRKKAEPKAGKNDFEPAEIISDLIPDMDAELIQHVTKLEQELAATKKKLKMQRKKFRQVLYGLAKHIDAKGISSFEVDDYIKGLNVQREESRDLEEEYEKFYSTYKYHIIDENMHQNGGLQNQSNKKTATKSNTNMLKGTTTDKGTPVGDVTSENPLSELSKISKPGRPKKDPAQKAAKANGDEEPKKRKSKKQKEGENGGLDVEEIPALEATGKAKKDEKAHAGNGDVLNIPPLIEDKGTKLPALDTNSLLNAYMLGAGGGHGLGLGIPGYGGMGAMPGMPMLSENDMAIYNKAFQELMKGAGMSQLLGGQNAADMLGYFSGNKE